MATKINISYSLKQNGIVSCWWHSVAGANRYSAFIRLVANGKAIGTSFTAATECLSSEKVIAGGVYRISVSARDAKNREIGSGELKFTVPSDFYARNLTAPTRVKAIPGTESVQISFDTVSGALCGLTARSIARHGPAIRLQGCSPIHRILLWFVQKIVM